MAQLSQQCLQVSGHMTLQQPRSDNRKHEECLPSSWKKALSSVGVWWCSALFKEHRSVIPGIEQISTYNELGENYSFHTTVSTQSTH